MNIDNHPAVFLDRDGVINENRVDYVKSWSDFVWIPGALGALRELAVLDWPIVVVTNHSYINRVLITSQEADVINTRMCAEVASQGGRIDAVYVCPHRPDERCACRKPEPGLLYQAAHDLGLNLQRSFLIGDSVSDMQAGFRVGCRLSMVLTGRGRSQLSHLGDLESVVHISQDLGDAVRWIKREIGGVC